MNLFLQSAFIVSFCIFSFSPSYASPAHSYNETILDESEAVRTGRCTWWDVSGSRPRRKFGNPFSYDTIVTQRATGLNLFLLKGAISARCDYYEELIDGQWLSRGH